MKLKKYIAAFALLATVLFSGSVLAQPSVQAETQQYKEAQFKVEYPQFRGIEDSLVEKKINMDVKVDVEKFIASCKKDTFNREAVVNYKIHYVDQDKLSFEVLTYTYNGGAHGASYVQGYTYDLKTGSKSTLTELFDYRPSELNQAIFRHAKARDIYLFTDFKGLKQYPQNFYLNEEGKAVLLFQQYEIAPYSSGIIRVEMG